MGVEEHRRDAPRSATVAIVTVSTTRTIDDDQSGQWMARRAIKEGHAIADHRVVTDDAEIIRASLLELIHGNAPDAVLMSGGTGIADKDVTIEAVRPLLDKELSAFGPLFAMLSFEEINSAALISRAMAGRIGPSMVFCLPGSLNACKLACKNLIFPELLHLVRHLRKG